MKLLTLLLTAATTTLAAPMNSQESQTMAFPKGSYHIVNNCDFSLSTWAVASTISNSTLLAPNSTTSAPFNYDPITGNAIKIATVSDALYTGAPIFHFSYTLNPTEGSIYYDLSTAYGLDPKFEGKKFVVNGMEGKGVPEIEWYGGQPSGTKAFFGDTDLWLTLCARVSERVRLMGGQEAGIADTVKQW